MVGLVPRIHSFSYVPEHQPADKAAERPHKDPVAAKLFTAREISADDPCLGRQYRCTVMVVADAEIPDGSCEPAGHRLFKVFAIEWKEIAAGSPEFPGHT